MFGGHLRCGFGRLHGQLTGFLANCGPLTAADAQKGGHFVQVRRDLFNIWIWLNAGFVFVFYLFCAAVRQS